MATDKLKEEEKVIFREAFKKFDPEGSDVISANEMGSVLRAAGQAPTEAELEDYKKVSLDQHARGSELPIVFMKVQSHFYCTQTSCMGHITNIEKKV